VEEKSWGKCGQATEKRLMLAFESHGACNRGEKYKSENLKSAGVIPAHAFA
jgi:hypothetical protein